MLQSIGVQYHFYADDSQIYITFGINNAAAAINKIEEVVSIICTWMAETLLCINEDKTEMLLVASKPTYYNKLNMAHVTTY